MKRSILIVEQDAQLAKSLTEHLREENYDVGIAINECEALSLLSTNTIRLVIADIDLPFKTDGGLLNCIRTNFFATKLIVMTEYPTVHCTLACMRNGVEALIFKPLDDFTEIDAALSKALENIERWEAKLSAVLENKHDKRTNTISSNIEVT